jgi:hypothetical protein
MKAQLMARASRLTGRDSMYLFGRCLAVRTVAILLALSSAAQAMDTGKLLGSVLDERTGDPVIGASVLIDSTTVGAQCDIDGHYVIDVPVGTHDVVVSSVGYVQKRVTDVTIHKGNHVSLDVAISPKAVDMGTIEVTTTKKKSSEAAVLVRRRTAPTVLDGLSTEAFRRSGDGDAAQSVKRVVGISVVDGKSLIVRGMGGRYTNVLLNGEALPSPEPEKREVPLDLFPTALLDEVMVSKTFTPDQRGGFSGGSLNLKTTEFPAALTYEFSSSGTYNSASTGKLRESYQGGDTDWLGIDDGTRDLPQEVRDVDWGSLTYEDADAQRLAGQSFKNQWTPEPSRTPLNSGYSLSIGNRYSMGGNRTLGVIGSFSYSNSYRVRNNERYVILKGTDPKAIPILDMDIDRGTQSVLWGSLLSSSLNLSENHKLTFRGIYNRSADDEAEYAYGIDGYNDGDLIRETTLSFVSRWVGSGILGGEHHFKGLFDSKVEWDAAITGANRYEPDYRRSLYQRVSEDRPWAAHSGSVPFTRVYTNVDDRGANVNLDWSLALHGNDSRLKFGGLFENKTRDFVTNRYTYNSRGPVDRKGLAEELLIPENIGGGNERPTWQLTDATKGTDLYNANEHTTAGYLMLDVKPLSKIRVVTGARYEDYDLAMNAPRLTTAPSFGLATADWLPMASVTYAFNDRTNLRLVASRTLGRPEFRELSPFTFPSESALGIPTTGNPDLRPTYIWNYDLRLEFFPHVNEVLAASLFAKDFTDPIEFYYYNSGTRGAYEYFNASGATNYGIELEARKSLDWLSKSLSAYSVGANIALVDSKVEIKDEDGLQVQAVNRPLMGQSLYTFNLMLGYTSPSAVTDATLLFNVSSERLVKVTVVNEHDIYEQPRHDLDFTLNHRLWNIVGLKFSVKNILNEDYKVTQKQGSGDEMVERVVESYPRGRSISFGVSYGI